MRIAVILNGISLAKNQFYKKILPALTREFQVEVSETLTVNDAILLASKAVNRRFDIIMATGGDGTVHQVVNGMLRNYEPPTRLPVLSVLPLGSGNDFARTIGGTSDPTELVQAIKAFKTFPIDVGEVIYAVAPGEEGVSAIRQKRYFVNVVDVGMGPTVVRKVLRSGRALGSSVAYYQSILSTFFTYKPVMLHARSSRWEWHSEMRTFAVANAKYYGNGLCIAPDARLDDDMLDVFACGGVSMFDFIIHSIPLKSGKRVRHKKVSYLNCKEVELSSDIPMEVEADGEIIGWLPATVKVSALKLQILKG